MILLYGQRMDGEPVWQELRNDARDGATWVDWYCQPPAEGVAYEVVRAATDAYRQGHPVKSIYEVTEVGDPHFPETDFSRVLREITEAHETIIGRLLAWRDSLTAATNVQPEAMVFLVPENVLPGVGSAFGTRVIHADVPEPMVALAVPKIG